MVFDLTFVLIHQSSYQIYVFINRFITTVKVPAKTFGHPVMWPIQVDPSSTQISDIRPARLSLLAFPLYLAKGWHPSIPQSTEVDILCLFKTHKPPAVLSQTPVYPPKKLSGIPNLCNGRFFLVAGLCQVIMWDGVATGDCLFDWKCFHYGAKRNLFAKYYLLYFNNPSSVANEVQEKNKGL